MPIRANLCCFVLIAASSCATCRTLAAQERFKKIARAYETLSDSRARRDHDEEMGVGETLNTQTAFSFPS